MYVLRSYQAATVQKADLTETETAVGNLTSGDVRPVAPTTDGTVQEVLAQAGQDVTQGQVLARLGSPALEQVRVRARDALLGVQDDQVAALQAARSAVGAAGRNVQTAAAAVPLAPRSLEGAEGLYALGGVARLDVETARVKAADAVRAEQAAGDTLSAAQEALRVARRSADLKTQAARDDLDRAVQALQDLVLRAPILGRVVDLNLRVGARVTAGTAALSVASLKDVAVALSLDETLAGRVRAGQSARITDGERTWPGEIVKVASATSAASGQSAPTVAAQARFVQLPAGLRLGGSASVEVRVATHLGVLTLPRAAFLSTGGEALAYVLNGEKAERREVVYGAQNDSQVEVRSGLQVGDRVIVSSYEAFKDQPGIQAPRSGELSGPNSSTPDSGTSDSISTVPGGQP